MQFKVNFEISKDMMMPIKFFETHLASSPPAYVIIYIFAFNKSKIISQFGYREIASELDFVTEGDVETAFLYWESKGIVKICDDTITFLNIETEEKTVFEKTVLIDARPTYSMQELQLYRKNTKEVEVIFKLTEKLLGTMLKSTDINTIFGIYDWLRIPADVIEVLLNHCLEKGDVSMAYVEKVALDWHNKGIKTTQMANEYLEKYSDNYIEIKKALGIKGRDITTAEENLIDKWKKEYGFGMEIILEACDKTVMQLGNPNLKYIDSVMENWYKADVKTLEDIGKFEEEHFSKKDKKYKKPTKSKNKFANFSQKGLDFEKLEKIAQERLQNTAKGDENGKR